MKAERGISAEGDSFLEHLNRGSDLLAAGELSQAREALEEAVSLRPEDPKALSLLGLCCFKLEELDEAASIYTSLAHDNPLDVTLHVNLGLVELKRGRPAAAIRALEVAVNLAPDHRRAHNYLGLAFYEHGEIARAREAFLQAGAEAMVEKMDLALREQAAEASEASAPAPAPAAEGGEGALEAVPELQAFCDGLRLYWPRGAPFAVEPAGAALDFAAGIYTRLDGLVVARGNTSWEPVRKRFRGELTGKSFGSGAEQVFHGTGGGQLIVTAQLTPDAPPRLFTPVRLTEDFYVVESRLFAFEEPLDFENGRVAGPRSGIDLNLVRLRGEGHVLLVTPRSIRTEAIYGNESIRLPKEGLVGWAGPITPRLLEGPGSAWVDLTGEGSVLLLA